MQRRHVKIQDVLKCTLVRAGRRTDAALWSKKFINNFKNQFPYYGEHRFFCFKD